MNYEMNYRFSDQRSVSCEITIEYSDDNYRVGLGCHG